MHSVTHAVSRPASSCAPARAARHGTTVANHLQQVRNSSASHAVRERAMPGTRHSKIDSIDGLFRALDAGMPDEVASRTATRLLNDQRDPSVARNMLHALPPRVTPNAYHFCAAISTCKRAGDAATAMQLFHEMPDYSAERTDAVYNALLMLLMKSDRPEWLAEVLQVMEKSKDPRVPYSHLTYNLLMQMHAAEGDGAAAEARLRALEAAARASDDRRLVPDLRDWSEVMNAHANGGDGASVERVLREALTPRRPLDDRRVLWHAAINACAKAGGAPTAERLLRAMEGSIETDVIAWTMVIQGWIERGDPNEAERVLWSMPRHVTPDGICIRSMLMAHRTFGLCDRIGRLLDALPAWMERDPSLRGEDSIWTVAMEAYAHLGRRDLAARVLGTMRAYVPPVPPNHRHYGALIAAAHQAKDTADASRWIKEAIECGVFRRIPGYDPDKDAMDFHLDAIVPGDCGSRRGQKVPGERQKAIQGTVGAALVRYHLDNRRFTPRTVFVVGQGGDGLVRQAVEEELLRNKLTYVVSKTNPGLLVPADPRLRRRPAPNPSVRSGGLG